MTYPQPQDWPTSERINNIGPNGNDGDHYMLKSLTNGDSFTLTRTGDKYKLIKKNPRMSEVESEDGMIKNMSNQCVVTKL